MWNLCMMCHGIHTYYAPEIYRVHRASVERQYHMVRQKAETTNQWI